MMGNNSTVSEWKEKFRLPQPTPRPSGDIKFLVVGATKNSMYFRLPAVGRLFPPTPLMKIITYLPWTLLTIKFYLSFY